MYLIDRMIKHNNKLKKLCNHLLPEYQYLDLVEDILDNGITRKTRNGYVHSKFGVQMRFDLRGNTMPILTSKKMAWKTCLRELLWFMRGHTDNRWLNKRNVHIWDANSKSSDKGSNTLLKEFDLGPIYGHQWRSFNATYDGCKDYKERTNKYDGRGVDQLQNIIDMLRNKEDRYSRRMIMSAWNPEQLDEMKLPPCHVLTQFWVNDKDELYCSLYQRSGDVGLGVPFNIASYSFLTHILAKHTGLKPGEFVHTIGDAHIYDEHVFQLSSQLKNRLYYFPTIEIKNKYENIDEYDEKDIKILNYQYDNKQVQLDMIV